MTELLQGVMGKLGNQVHPMIQTLFPNNDAVSPIHTAGALQSWFEEHEGELQHFLWPAQHHIRTSLNLSGKFSRLE
jgi:hypothetical protein